MRSIRAAYDYSQIESRQEEADQLRRRAVERAQIEADLAQRRFMLVDPGNRLVADTLEADWNDKLRALAAVREDYEHARQDDERLLGQALRERLVAMTADFTQLWSDPETPNRERKRMLDLIIEDATLVKLPAEKTTKVHLRFKGGRTHTITTMNRRSSAEQVKTLPRIVELVDKLLDKHTPVVPLVGSGVLQVQIAATPHRGGLAQERRDARSA